MRWTPPASSLFPQQRRQVKLLPHLNLILNYAHAVPLPAKTNPQPVPPQTPTAPMASKPASEPQVAKTKPEPAHPANRKR